MSETQKALELAIARILKPLRYKKRATTWHLDHPAETSVLNLQKSQWGEDWYLNLGVYLKSLGAETRPPEARCHIRCRATSLTGQDMPRDAAGLSALVRDVAAPWLEALSTERGIAEFLASDRSRSCFINSRVAEAFGADPGAPSA